MLIWVALEQLNSYKNKQFTIIDFVEGKIYNMPFSETGRKNKKKKEEDALYQDLANGLLVN